MLLQKSPQMSQKFDTEYDRAKGPPYNGKDPPPAPGSLKTLLFPPLLNKVQNKGAQGVQTRYGAELPPFISIVRCPVRPVILGTEKYVFILIGTFFLKKLPDQTKCRLPFLSHWDSAAMATLCVWFFACFQRIFFLEPPHKCPGCPSLAPPTLPSFTPSHHMCAWGLGRLGVLMDKISLRFNSLGP